MDKQGTSKGQASGLPNATSCKSRGGSNREIPVIIKGTNRELRFLRRKYLPLVGPGMQLTTRSIRCSWPPAVHQTQSSNNHTKELTRQNMNAAAIPGIP